MTIQPYGSEPNEVVHRLRQVLSTVQLGCRCREQLDGALDRFIAFEFQRRVRHARQQRDRIAMQVSFLAELDEVTVAEIDHTVFEEMALMFDGIAEAAAEAALAIRQVNAPFSTLSSASVLTLDCPR